MNIYVVAQVESDSSTKILGIRSMNFQEEDAIMDRNEALLTNPKNEKGWPYWKILLFDATFIKVLGDK